MRQSRRVVAAALLAASLFLLPALSFAAGGGSAAWRSSSDLGLFELALDWLSERWEALTGGSPVDRILQPSGCGIDPNGPPCLPPPPPSDLIGSNGSGDEG